MAESVCETGNLQVALTGMANEAGAASGIRIRRFDQLAADASSMWAVHLTTPTILAGMGFRVAQQSGGWPVPTNPPGK